MNPGYHPNYRGLMACLAIAIHLLMGATTRAEDGDRLWLRYDPLPKQMIDLYRPRVTARVVPGQSATLDAIRTELVNGCTGLLGSPVPVAEDARRDGAVIVGTPQSSPLIAGLNWEQRLSELGPEGF